MSAQKAERIYDEKKVLQRNRNFIMKLESEQMMNEIQGLPKNGDLELRISAARSKYAEQEAEIAQMESDYQDWLRDNA
jgi:hypothetical protein